MVLATNKIIKCSQLFGKNVTVKIKIEIPLVISLHIKQYKCKSVIFLKTIQHKHPRHNHTMHLKAVPHS